MIGQATTEGTRLKAAWSKHLSRYPWTHFATLTFRTESVQDYARRQFLSFVRHVEREIGDAPLVASGDALVRGNVRVARRERSGGIYWFYGTEYGQLGRMHLHALLGRTETLPRDVLQEHWPNGWSRFLSYDPQLGAAHYVSKYITKDLADYDVSPSFPLARALYVGRQRELTGLAPRLSIAPGERPQLSSSLPSQRRRFQS